MPKNPPSVEMKVEVVESVRWFLNGPGAWLNRHLSAKWLAFLWGRLLGWVPIMRYTFDGSEEIHTITIRDALGHLVEKRANEA